MPASSCGRSFPTAATVPVKPARGGICRYVPEYTGFNIEVSIIL